MIKHFCDICGVEITNSSSVDDVTLLTNILEGQFCVMPSHETNCEICVSCAHTIVRTIDMMKRGKEVVYK